MELVEARHRFSEARVAVLATITSDGHAHLVPCCCVLVADTVYSAVDAKPKSTLALRRLDNLRANPAASLLVHHYAEDWSTLWWVRADGLGRLVDTEGERSRALEVLAAKYSQYEEALPPGEVWALEVERWRAWP